MLQAVVDSLKELARGMVDPKAIARERAEKETHTTDTKSRERKLERDLEKAQRTRLNAYKDKASGTLSKEEFQYISKELRREEANCRRQLEQLRKSRQDGQDLLQMERKIRDFLQFEKLNKAQLQQLVRRIEVDDEKNITIEFAFTEPKGAD